MFNFLNLLRVHESIRKFDEYVRDVVRATIVLAGSVQEHTERCWNLIRQ
jgi:hypothetical protein